MTLIVREALWMAVSLLAIVSVIAFDQAAGINDGRPQRMDFAIFVLMMYVAVAVVRFATRRRTRAHGITWWGPKIATALGVCALRMDGRRIT